MNGHVRDTDIQCSHCNELTCRDLSWQQLFQCSQHTRTPAEPALNKSIHTNQQEQPNSIQSIWIRTSNTAYTRRQHYCLLLIWHAYLLWLESIWIKFIWFNVAERNNKATHKPQWLQPFAFEVCKDFSIPTTLLVLSFISNSVMVRWCRARISMA